MTESAVANDTFFFVHVMKTAGMSFNQHIHANFPRHEVYPGADDQTGIDYWVINRLKDCLLYTSDAADE